MKKKYIKMNEKNFLSLGEVINSIKEISDNPNAMQNEIFSCIFNTNNVKSTTINNYCIGIRAIGIEYKNSFIKNYEEDKLFDIVLQIINILDNKIHIKNEYTINDINSNKNFNKLIKNLLNIGKNDIHINDINILIKNNNYNTFKEILYYAIIKNKQPLFKQDINIKYNKNELEDYMKVKLYWGHSHIGALIELANKNNMYACADLGSMEVDGLISGTKNYENAYNYYLKAANKNHPKGCWMIANLMITNKIKFDFNIMWNYLNKSIELGSAAGYNTMGICYLKGINKNKKKDEKKAIYYFKIAADLGYSFGYNNIGKIFENKNNINEAIKYYKLSADMNNSWASNKVAEYYRKNNDLETALIYYKEAIKAPINEVCPYAYYNIATYFYKNNNKKLYNQYIKLYNKTK